MPYNGSGTFSLTYDWTTEQASSPIEISKLDEQEADIAAGLSNCILRDGTGVPTSATPWNSQNLTGVGSLTAVTGTFSGAVTATALVPSSSTVPANGLYLPAANTVGIASNTTLRASVNSTGNWTFAAASSGDTITVAPGSTLKAIGASDGTRSSGWYQLTTGASFGSISNHPLTLFSNNTDRLVIASSGNVTINAPSSGTTLALTSVAAGEALNVTDGTVSARLAGFASTTFNIGTTSAHSTYITSNGTQRIGVNSTGNVTINAPSSAGNSLTVGTAASSYGIVIDQQATTPGLRISNGSGSMYLQASGGNSIVGTDGAWGLDLYTNTTQRLSISSGGNVTINAPSSGVALAVTGVSGTAAITGGLVSLGEAVGLSSGANVYSTSTTQLNLGTNGAAATNLFTNATARVQIASAGNVTINAPSSGYTLDAVGVANTTLARFKASSGWGGISVGGATSDWLLLGDNAASGALSIYGGTSPNTTLQISSTRNVSIAAPSSGATLAQTVIAGGWNSTISDGTATLAFQCNGGSGSYAGTTTAHNFSLVTSGTARVTLAAASGNVTFTGGLSGITTLAMTGALSGATTISATSTISDQAGDVRVIPQNAQTGNYTCVLSDAGKHIYHASGAGAGDTYTIPANSSVAYTIGTAITFINRATDAVSIAITTDTLTQAGTGATGTRALAAYGVATAIKITSTEWIISGTGLT